MRPSSTSESSQTTSSNVKSRSNTLPNCTARDRLSSSNQSRGERIDRIDSRTPNKDHPKTRPESEYQKNRIETERSTQDRTIEAIVNVLGKGIVLFWLRIRTGLILDRGRSDCRLRQV